MKRAADAVSAVKKGYSGSYAAAPARTNQTLYTDANPLGGPSFEDKVKRAVAGEAAGYAHAGDISKVH